MLAWNSLKPGMQNAELLPSCVEYRYPPVNLRPIDEYLFNHELERGWESCNAIKLSNVNILGHSWMQWNYMRFVDVYRPCNGPRRRKRGRLMDLLQIRHPAHSFDEALWVHDDWSGNYFHWLSDVLPKLVAWCKTDEPCRQVLLPQQLLLRPYVSESLALLGFHGLGFNRPHLHLNSLIVIGPTAPTGNFRSSLLNEIRDKLLEPVSKDATKSFYISRVDASKRFLVNEHQLAPILMSYDIQSVQLEGRSLAEQIELFRSCKLIVGLHGAGLTNMLWMPAGGHVIEIRRKHDSHNNCYFAMASALGHQYSFLNADHLGNVQDTLYAELRIDPSLFEDYLGMICSC